MGNARVRELLPAIVEAVTRAGHRVVARCPARRTDGGRRPRGYARTSFLYCTRCGWSASGPFRRFRSSMYDS